MDVSPSQLRKVLGQNVKQRRRELSLTQEDLAEAAGVTQAFISSLERGATSISVDTLASLAESLKVAPSILLGQESFASVA
jgi:transcriptional regulator with XRE-family HTH domain